MFDTTISVALCDTQLQAALSFVDSEPPGLPILVRPSIKGLAQDVARDRGNVTADELFSLNASWRVVHAKQEVMWRARQAGYTLNMIGRRFPSWVQGKHLDHTTILHGVKAHARRRRAALMAAVQADNELHARAYGGRS